MPRRHHVRRNHHADNAASLKALRRGMNATYGKKVRYCAEKKHAEWTKIPAPEMPLISVDPAITLASEVVV